ncbi:MAG: phosphotransferase, partial [Propionibacteriaceae bacterium]
MPLAGSAVGPACPPDPCLARPAARHHRHRCGDLIWQDALRLPKPSGPAVWVHGDLSPGNVLLTDGRLSAVIA